MTKTFFAVFGASGFGREVMPLVRHSQPDCEVVFIDDNPPADRLNGHQVLSYEDFLASDAPVKSVCIAIADASVRQRLTEQCLSDGVSIFKVQSDSVVVLDDVTLGDGSILCPFTTITSNVSIGVSFQANIYSYVAHDCVIGDYVTFAPGVKCNGNVVIEDHVYVGTGAVIKQGKPGKPLIIGRGAVIGMGAVVTKNVSPGAIVVGNPAKPMLRKGLGG